MPAHDDRLECCSEVGDRVDTRKDRNGGRRGGKKLRRDTACSGYLVREERYRNQCGQGKREHGKAARADQLVRGLKIAISGCRGNVLLERRLDPSTSKTHISSGHNDDRPDAIPTEPKVMNHDR